MSSCIHLIYRRIRYTILLLTALVVVEGIVAQGRLQTDNSGRAPVINDNTTQIDRPATTQASRTAGSQNPNQIESEITYKANDSIILFRNGTAYLHGETEINYQQIKLTADFVRVKIDSSLIYARGTAGEDGKKFGEPVFSEGEASYNSKELMYNLRSKKGFIRQVVTQEGEGYIISDKTKKTPDNIFCMAGGKYTTCDNHDHPDFYLSISKGKVKPGEYIVTGPAHLVIADVPLPIALPFGFFPFTSKYSSGVLMPRFSTEMTRGFGLTNGGYYFALNDYFDLELLGDIYTRGTWAVSASSNYVKRYKFRGNFSFSYREDVTGEKGFPEYRKDPNLSIRWSHSQDPKSNPNFSFSSSVNFSTSGYNRSNINSFHRPEINSQNTTSSSINFTKRFPEIPSLSLSGGMQISQRTRDSTISLSLPNINISYSRFFPFKRKVQTGRERWYEKISMSYSGAFANSIDTKENKLLRSSFSRDWRNGMRHSIPISATFNLFNHINITPAFNYQERWYLKAVDKSWDKQTQKLINDTVPGFYRVYDFNMGVSASTKLYGFFIPSRKIFGDKIDRIRHVMTPSMSFNYLPDFGDSRWGYYSSYVRSVRSATNPDVYTDTEVNYSRFEGSLYGVPGRGTSGSIGFNLGNNLEMKVKNEEDTTGTNPFRIISLVDNLNISGGYNLVADSMNWSSFNVSLRLKLTQNYSLSLSTSFDPYMFGLNSAGNPVRINQLRWNHGKLPRFQGTGTSYSYTINNDTFRKLFGRKKDEVPGSDSSGNSTDNRGTDDADDAEGNLTGRNQDNTAENQGSGLEINEDGYAKFSMPWSFSINYSVRYQNTTFNKQKMEYDMGFMHNLSVNGNISLTPNWRISGNSTYDFKAKQFTYTSISVNRSLHCWNMSASFVPFGQFKSYSFHIGVNASMLSDLKYDKRSEFGVNNITWY